MIDVHPPHQPVHSWKDFLIHMSAICLGLLIAIGLEQSVEYMHHRHQANEARASIQAELHENAAVLQRNAERLATDQRQLAKDMDVLNSSAPDAQTLAALQYSWYMVRTRDAAWNAAKTDGSVALIPSQDISAANYLYSTNTELTQITLSYFADIETAAAIVDHARVAGKLDQSERDQLRQLTATAIGRTRVLSMILRFQLQAASGNTLNR